MHLQRHIPEHLGSKEYGINSKISSTTDASTSGRTAAPRNTADIFTLHVRLA
jgi:hypothetical protein